MRSIKLLCIARDQTQLSRRDCQTLTAFVPVTLDEAASGPTPKPPADIRVEVHRTNTTIVVKWPPREPPRI